MVRARFKAGGPGEVGTTELGAPMPLLSSTRPAGTGSQLWRYEAYQPMIRSRLVMADRSPGWVAAVVVVCHVVVSGSSLVS
jgi:methylthioribose-1-phosphate isomerase